VNVLAYKLREMAENLAVDLGPSDDDRQVMREAADLLDSENTTAALRMLLTDKKRLSAALEHLDNKQLGVVLGSALKQLDNRGDSTLPTLLRALADRVERLERSRGGEVDRLLEEM
jgi:hypothetical protein